MDTLSIDPRALPAEGTMFIGQLAPSIFQLPTEDALQPAGPVVYHLRAFREDTDLVITGHLHAPFDLQCVRCLKTFRHHADFDPYDQSIPIEKEEMIDLTNWIREDILLALPSYPRCEDASVDPHECPAEGRFDVTSEPEADDPPDADSGTWDALDQIKR